MFKLVYLSFPKKKLVYMGRDPVGVKWLGVIKSVVM